MKKTTLAMIFGGLIGGIMIVFYNELIVGTVTGIVSVVAIYLILNEHMGESKETSIEESEESEETDHEDVADINIEDI